MKIIRLITLLLALLMTFNGQCQYGWLDHFGSNDTDVGYCIVSESGSTYAGGWFQGSVTFGTTTLTSFGGTDIFLLRLDSLGNTIWAKEFGGSGDDYIAGISSDGHGNLYFSGSFSDQAHFGTFLLASNGESDAYICRITTDGNVKWVLNGGGYLPDQAYRVNVSPTGDFVAFTGYFREFAQFGPFTIPGMVGREFFVARVDTSGVYRWIFAVPGISDEVGYGIDVDSSGNIYSAGYFFSEIWQVGSYNLVNAGAADCSLMKFDSKGNLLWAKRFGGYEEDLPRSVKCYNGSVYIGGYHYGSGNFLGINLPGKGGKDSFVIKADADGNAIWAADGVSAMDDEMVGLAVDADDNVYTSGAFSGTMTIGNSSYYSAGAYDAYCLKIDGSSGIGVKAITGGGSDNDAFFGVCVKGLDTVQLAGYFSETAHFGSNTLVSAGLWDILFAETSDFLVGLSKQNRDTGIQIFPNPAQKVITCRFDKSIPVRLNLFNSLGVMIKTIEPATAHEITVDCSQMPTGMYYLTTDDNFSSSSRKVIILR